MFGYDCCHYVVIIVTNTLLLLCNSVEGSPAVAVMGGVAYMRWTVSTNTIGSRNVYNPHNISILVFINKQTNPSYFAPNVNYTGDISKGIMSFTLYGVTKADIGKYKYILPGPNEDGEQDLVIAESPNITGITELSPPAVSGGNYTLNCNAVSTSIPASHNLTMLSEWKKNGISIPLGSRYNVNGTILVINSLVRADSGDNFTCVTYEDPRKKSEESGGFILIVFYGPDNVHITPAGDLTVDEEGNVNITCAAECNPPCQSYRWQNGSDHTLVGSDQSLVIRKVRREQAGLYICNVTNAKILLSATAHKNVYINYGPDNPLQLSPSNTSYRVVENLTIPNISCTSPCFPSCSFQWTGPMVSSTGIISLGTVHRSKRGNYTCKGQNLRTNKDASSDVVTLFVIYGPDTPVIEPSATEYRLNESDVLPNIQCSADCFPNCTSRWYNGTTPVPGSPADTLSIGNVYRNETGNYTCRSVNTESRVEREKTLQLVVQYPPVVTMESRNGSHGDTELMLNCSAYGIPEQYTYKLTHNSLFSGIEIRQLKYSSITTGVIVHQFTNLSYMDTGNYTCSVNNGIPDFRDGSLDKSVTSTVLIKGKLYLTSNEFNFCVEKGQSVKLVLEFYNSLLAAQVMWYRLKNETPEYLQSSDKYNFSVSGTMVNVMFYSVHIQQPGLMASLEIKDVTEEDFTIYEVHVNNSVGEMPAVTLELRPKGPPDVPQNVHIVQGSITISSVGIGWVSGFHGGSSQTFVIEYRRPMDESWTKFPNVIFGGMSLSKDFNITVMGLDHETLYLFRMYSWNTYKKSNYSAVINSTTYAGKDALVMDNRGDAIIISSVTGAVAVIAVVLAVFLLYRRRRMSKLNNDGLVDNPVYDTSGPASDPFINSGAGGIEYPEVVKPKNQVSEVRDLSSIYAQVDKTKKTWKEETAMGKHGKTSKGDVYENVDLVGKRSEPEIVYQNAKNTKAEDSCDNLYEDPGAPASIGSGKNKDGLLYADLMLDPPTTKNGKYVIRGIENHTEYAEIAYGKRGKPLPDSEKEKENSDTSEM